MEILNKIFNWKVFAILYVLMLIVSVGFSPIEDYLPSTPYNSLLDIMQWLFVLFSVGICYAAGWKKRICSNATVAFGIMFSIITIFLVSFQVATDADVLSGFSIFIDFFLSFLLITLFNILPFIAAVTYFVKSDEYTPVEKPFCKIFCLVMLLNFLASLIKFVYNHLIFDSIYDYIDIVMSFVLVVIGICYSWNIKLRNKNIVNILALLVIASFCVPVSLHSQKYIDFTGIHSELSNIVGLLYLIACSVFWVIIVYRYAFTKEIYNQEANND